MVQPYYSGQDEHKKQEQERSQWLSKTSKRNDKVL